MTTCREVSLIDGAARQETSTQHMVAQAPPTKSVMWAPWRLAYILADKDEACVFCAKAASGDDEVNLVLARGKYTFAILNLFPYNNGHLMVMPYRHVAVLADLDADELLEMMQLAQAAECVLKECMAPDGLNVGMNLGAVAGAGIENHLHLHLVPRWQGDTNFMPVLSDTDVIPQSLRDAYRQLSGPLKREVSRLTEEPE